MVLGDTAALLVNVTKVGGFVVGPGKSQSITMSDINSIEIIEAGTTPSNNVKVSFSINYKF
ncbi:S-Ena type endospore appendage [Bacillus thuringiensis]|uniref:S-Ena type endospore appendage n=1 Tax=Bacillus thuringiensis TaxID=1428 RepID=UPI0021147CC9|nr:S-Ena type endospore appendage [Bacillus thuringiensis]